MASNKTPNLGLDVWAESDYFKRAELNGNFTNLDEKIGVLKADLTKVEINLLDYKNLAVGNDWTAAFQKAINDASNNARIRVPYGYYEAAGVVSNGKSLSIKMEGATIVQNKNLPVFDFTGGWESKTSVVSISTVTYDFSQGNNLSSPVSKISLSSTPNFKQGDVVKVYANDEIPNAYQLTQKKRVGEFATVAAVIGNDVYLTGLLRETYTSNIRIAKLKDCTITIEGSGDFDTLSIGESANPKWNAKMIKIASFKFPKIKNLTCRNSYESFLLLMSNFGYTVEGVSVLNAKNEPSNGRYGYGINDNNNEGGKVNNCHFTNCRHGYTTTSNAIDPNIDIPELYGRSANTVVSNSTSYGCTNAGFDVHEEAWDITFSNCRSDSDYAGAVASGCGFQSRAKKIKFVNCSVSNSLGGFTIFEQYAGTTSETSLINCYTNNVDFSISSKGSTGTGIRVRKLKINGGRFESFGQTGNIFQNVDVEIENAEIISNAYLNNILVNANMYMRNTKLVNKSSNTGTRAVNLDQGSLLQFNQLIIDVSGVATTDAKLLRITDVNSSIKGDYLDVVTNGKTISTVFDSSGTSIGTLSVRNVKVDSAQKVLNSDNYSSSSFTYETPSTSSNVIFQDLAADGAVLATKGVADLSVYIRVKALTTNRILGQIPLGARLGQKLVIRNSASSYTTTIKHGTTYNTAIGADIVLPVDGAVILIWTGSQWVNTK